MSSQEEDDEIEKPTVVDRWFWFACGPMELCDQTYATSWEAAALCKLPSVDEKEKMAAGDRAGSFEARMKALGGSFAFAAAEAAEAKGIEGDNFACLFYPPQGDFPGALMLGYSKEWGEPAESREDGGEAYAWAAVRAAAEFWGGQICASRIDDEWRRAWMEDWLPWCGHPSRDGLKMVEAFREREALDSSMAGGIERKAPRP